MKILNDVRVKFPKIGTEIMIVNSSESSKNSITFDNSRYAEFAEVRYGGHTFFFVNIRTYRYFYIQDGWIYWGGADRKEYKFPKNEQIEIIKCSFNNKGEIKFWGYKISDFLSLVTYLNNEKKQLWSLTFTGCDKYNGLSIAKFFDKNKAIEFSKKYAKKIDDYNYEKMKEIYFDIKGDYEKWLIR